MKRSIITIITAMILLIIGFMILMPNNTNVSSRTEYATIVVKNGELTTGPSAISVQQGDTVTLRITSDQPDEFHLHGYDEKANLAAGNEATLTFTAHQTGKFEYELEQTQLTLGQLQVYPR